MRHAGIYARISQDKNGRAEGVAEQIRWGREYSAATWPGLPLVVYQDNDITGTEDDRPELGSMRQAIRDGECVQVVTTYQSRLTRSYAWFAMAKEMTDAGVGKIHTRHDGIVDVGGLLADILAVLNVHEIKLMREKLMDRLNANAAKGEAPGSLPFGYRHALDSDGNKSYSIVPEQADTIRLAAKRVLVGWSLSAVAAALSDQGITGAHGGTITGRSVRFWLTLPTVAGWRVHQGIIAGRGNWEPILDEDTWQACRAKLSAPRTVTRSDGITYPVTPTRPGGTARKYALTGGLAVCGVCGSPMNGQRLQTVKGQPYLICSRRADKATGRRGACTGILLQPTEDLVVGRLFAELDKPEFLDAIAEDVHAARREEITTALSAIDGKRRELSRMWSADTLTSDEWTEAKAALGQRERDLRDELNDKCPPPSRLTIAQARASWPSMNLGERREFLRLFIGAVTISPATPGLRAFDPGRVTVTDVYGNPMEAWRAGAE